MISILKLCLVLVGLAGISSAVAVPLSLKSKGGSSQSFSNSRGGGFSAVSVESCSALDKEKSVAVEFGEKEKRSVCGTIDSESQSLSDSEKYSEFFKQEGDNKGKNGNTNVNQGQGTQQCYSKTGNLSLQGALLVSLEGVQHIGLCDGTLLDKTKFVRKEKKDEGNAEKLTFSVCDSDCGELEPRASDGETQTIYQEKENSGKKVSFYENEKR